MDIDAITEIRRLSFCMEPFTISRLGLEEEHHPKTYGDTSTQTTRYSARTASAAL